MLVYERSCLSPAWLGGVVSQAPIRRPDGMRADAMTMCPGTGLLSQMIERGLAAGLCREASVPGAKRSPWSAGAFPAVPVALAACVASRW